MRSFFFLLFILFCASSQANTYGYLKVQVVQSNAEHTTNVRLKLNDTKIAEFSHSRTNGIRIAIQSNTLASGESTSLNSDYSSLQKGCKFSFQITYSLDGNHWIDIGTYEAPTTSVQTRLPIGICNGSVCSNDSTIKQQILAAEEALWKQNGEAIKKWLEDNTKREEELVKKNNEKIIKLQIEPEQNTDVSYEDIERSAQDLKPEIVVDERQVFMSLDTVIENALDVEQLVRALDRVEHTQEFYESCRSQDHYGKYFCQKYGSFGWLGAAAEVCATALSTDPDAAMKVLKQRILDPSVETKLVSNIEKQAEMKLRIQSVIEVKQIEDVLATLSKTARPVLSFTPLNDGLDFCEALTGKVMCLDSGEDLSHGERFLAAMGIIAGSRLLWTHVADNIKLNIFSDFADGIKRTDHHILLKDLDRVNVKTAEEVNEFLNRGARYTVPPYKKGTKVFEFTTNSKIKGNFVRVMAEENMPPNRWFMDKNSIKDLTPRQIKDKFSLPETPTHIADVTIPEGVTLRKGIASKEFGSSGKNVAIQYEIAVEKLPIDQLESFFTNVRKLK